MNLACRIRRARLDDGEADACNSAAAALLDGLAATPACAEPPIRELAGLGEGHRLYAAQPHFAGLAAACGPAKAQMRWLPGRGACRARSARRKSGEGGA